MAFGRRNPPQPPDQKPVSIPSSESPPLQPTQDDDLGPCVAATHDLMEMLRASYSDSHNRVHAETLIGGAAALTGEFALRSLGKPLPDKGFVFGDPINDILFEGASQGRPTLWLVVSDLALNAGLAERDLPDVVDILKRVAARISHIADTGHDGGGFPPITVPRENYPHEWSPNAGPRLRHKVTAIGLAHDLSPRQLAFAMAMATGGLISQTRDVLAPAISTQLAAEIMFSTAKMAPLAEPVV